MTIAIDPLLRVLAALVAALCGVGLISFVVLLPFAIAGFDVDSARIVWGWVPVFIAFNVFLFAFGLFLVYIAVNHFRRGKS